MFCKYLKPKRVNQAGALRACDCSLSAIDCLRARDDGEETLAFGVGDSALWVFIDALDMRFYVTEEDEERQLKR